MASIYIINASGEKELFSPQKLYRSAIRVGASGDLAKNIVRIIEREAYEGMKTLDIFRRVKELLYLKTPRASIRFSLKEGMRKLGPTGFPFERLVGEIFESLGYEVKMNQHISGFCLKDYEIDFVAKKGKSIYIVECKYRNLPGEKVHSKDALANYARFLDIQKGPYFKALQKQKYQVKTLMATNTKFTNDARNYSSCMGVGLLGWKYPKNEGLEYLIEKHKLYPVTILPSLAGYLKDTLISEGIILVKDILGIDSQKFVKQFKLPKNKIDSLIEEAKMLLGY